MSRELEAALEIAMKRGDMTRGAAQEVRELERNLQKGMWVVRGTGEEINLEETPQILEDFWVFIRELRTVRNVTESHAVSHRGRFGVFECVWKPRIIPSRYQSGRRRRSFLSASRSLRFELFI